MCLADIKKLFLAPNAFFSEKKTQTSLVPSLKLYVISLIVSSLVSVLVLWLVPNSLLSSPLMQAGISPIGVLVGGVIGGVIGLFIASGIVHVFAILLGGKRGFFRTFNAFAYASVPMVLLEWIIYTNPIAPVISIVFLIWFLYLLVNAVSAFHEVSKGRACAIVLVPLAIVIIIAIIIAFFVAIFLITAVASGGGLGPIEAFN